MSTPSPCSFPDPPSFPNASVSVPENALANALVGGPMNATSPAAGVAITYTIVGGNGSLLFKIGLCSGQIQLRTSNSLDYTVANVYTLIVQAAPNGIVLSAVNATVTVDVLYVNKVRAFPWVCSDFASLDALVVILLVFFARSPRSSMTPACEVCTKTRPR